MSISKTSKCLISLNFLKKKKGAKCNNFQRNQKKKFKEILVLKILRLLIALKHSFKGFKGQKALFKPFDIFLIFQTNLFGIPLLTICSHIRYSSSIINIPSASSTTPIGPPFVTPSPGFSPMLVIVLLEPLSSQRSTTSSMDVVSILMAAFTLTMLTYIFSIKVTIARTPSTYT